MPNKIKDAFGAVRADDALRSATAQFLREERAKAAPKRSARTVWCAALSVACSLILLFAGVGAYSAVQTPVSFVSIDVNPSLELGLNRFDRVVSATPYNHDAKAVLDGVQVIGKSCTDAINTIMESSGMQSFLTADAAPVFTVAAANESKAGALRTEIESTHGCSGHGGESAVADASCLNAAHESGLSFGKYAAFLTLSAYESDLTAEDCRGMSMSDIRTRIHAHESGEHAETNAEEDSCAEEGENEEDCAEEEVPAAQSGEKEHHGSEHGHGKGHD